jgi:hypothetical protein
MRQTKLELALEQKMKNWVEIEKLVSKSNNLTKVIYKTA